MGGVFIPVLPKTEFNFSHLGASATEVIRISGPIDCINYDKAVLAVRVHARNMPDVATDPTLKIACVTTVPALDDEAEFSLAADVIAVTVTITTPTIPGVLTAAFTAGGLGPYLKLVLTATQGSVASNPFFACLSADLALRE